MIQVHASRRSFLTAGSLGLGGLALPVLLRARAADPAPSRETAVILVFLSGGPAQLDTFDPKPDAPVEFRGPFASIPTALPGIRFTELFPELAARADRLSVLRSVRHATGGHHHGDHWVMTGTHPDNLQFGVNHRPAVGAVAARFRGPNRPGMPAYVGIPRETGYGGPAYLGPGYACFPCADPNAPDFRGPNLRLPAGVTADVVADRRRLTGTLDRMRRDLDARGTAAAMDGFRRAAYDLVLGADARAAFDLGREDGRLRDRYGRTRVGQSCLMARRLVEAGVTFVVVEDFEHTEWDLHGPSGGNLTAEAGTRIKGPHLDRALSALLDDLAARGRLDSTLVVAMGEFGRTPRINGTGGRDHYPFVYSVLLAGGGLRHGQVIGASDARAEHPRERPLGPGDVLATVYHVLGIDPRTAPADGSGRPIPLVEKGDVIRELT